MLQGDYVSVENATVARLDLMNPEFVHQVFHLSFIEANFHGS